MGSASKRGNDEIRFKVSTYEVLNPLVGMILFGISIPSRERSHGTHRKGSSENHRLKMSFLGDMLVPWRVHYKFINSEMFVVFKGVSQRPQRISS